MNILTAVLVFIIIFSLLKLKFDINYTKNEADEYLLVVISTLCGFIKYKKKTPIISRLFNNSAENVKSKRRSRIDISLSKFVPHLDKIHKLILQFFQINTWMFKHISCKKLSWNTRVGLFDPAVTGIAVGLLWPTKHYLYCKFKNTVNVLFEQPDLNIEPDFKNEKIYTHFNCILTLRTAHIIIAGIRFLVLIIVLFFILKGVRQRERSSN